MKVLKSRDRRWEELRADSGAEGKGGCKGWSCNLTGAADSKDSNIVCSLLCPMLTTLGTMVFHCVQSFYKEAFCCLYESRSEVRDSISLLSRSSWDCKIHTWFSRAMTSPAKVSDHPIAEELSCWALSLSALMLFNMASWAKTFSSSSTMSSFSFWTTCPCTSAGKNLHNNREKASKTQLLEIPWLKSRLPEW